MTNENQDKNAKVNIERNTQAANVASEMRTSRSAEDLERTDQDGTSMTLQERLALIRSEWSDDILPAVPNDEKFHYCWLSTTNQADPIYRRLRLGYELVQYGEMKQFGLANRVNSGEYEGCVAINEMILSRIPLELYNELMTIAHYERPNDEEKLLKANLKLDEEDSEGNALGIVEGTGMAKLGKNVRRPSFIR